MSMSEIGNRFYDGLTPKEQLILPMVAAGMANQEIATELGTKVQVIKNYLRSMYAKAGMDTRIEFVVFLFRHRVIECPCGQHQD